MRWPKIVSDEEKSVFIVKTPVTSVIKLFMPVIY
jgi:hypothetical protein